MHMCLIILSAFLLLSVSFLSFFLSSPFRQATPFLWDSMAPREKHVWMDSAGGEMISWRLGNVQKNCVGENRGGGRVFSISQKHCKIVGLWRRREGSFLLFSLSFSHACILYVIICMHICVSLSIHPLCLSLHQNIPHSAIAVEACTYMAKFFVDQARSNKHVYAYDQLLKDVIWNFNPIYSLLNGSNFVQIYVWE